MVCRHDQGSYGLERQGEKYQKLGKLGRVGTLFFRAKRSGKVREKFWTRSVASFHKLCFCQHVIVGQQNLAQNQ